jgi:delta-aminolevulinic acid dehydratase/porphobilinogen synthase
MSACAYTDHGHCGVVDGQTVDNDATLDLLARTALSHAQGRRRHGGPVGYDGRPGG